MSVANNIVFGLVLIATVTGCHSTSNQTVSRSLPKPIYIIRPHLKSPPNFESYNMIHPQDYEYLEDIGFDKKNIELPSGVIYR